VLRRVLLQSWQSPNLLTVLLWPLSLVYRLGAAGHRGLYQIGFKKRSKAELPVIVVGNLTVGGTGKTPLVIHIVELLQSQGYRPGVISRGYLADGDRGSCLIADDDSAKEVGDEALLIAQRTGVPVAVGSKRHTSIELLKAQCDVIVSDDGLQHWALMPHISVCIHDADADANRCLLPAGSWREPKKRLSEFDICVARDADQDQQDCYAMTLGAESPISLLTDNSALFPRDEVIHAVAGIARPARFFASCRALGYQIIEHAFGDHHHFTPQDIEFGGQVVLMTEKDAVKCRHFASEQHWYLPVSAKLSDDFNRLLLAKLSSAIT